MCISFRYFKYPPAVIQLVVLLYVPYPLSLRQVEEMLFERGLDICHETVRLWWNRFGPELAKRIRKKCVSYPYSHSNWRWHLDEVFVRINGKTHYLWRAVDHEGEVLDAVASTRRDKKTAVKLLKRLMKRYENPSIIVTDRLRSYGAAMREIGCIEKQDVGKWKNNRAENSHLPFRRREYAMLRFRKLETLEKFTAIHGQVYNHFNGERHLNNRQTYKNIRSEALSEWRSLVE